MMHSQAFLDDAVTPPYRRADLWTASQVRRVVQAAFPDTAAPHGATERWLRGPVGRMAVPPITIGGHARYHPYHVAHYIVQRRRLPFRGCAPSGLEPTFHFANLFSNLKDEDQFTWSQGWRSRAAADVLITALRPPVWPWHPELSVIAEKVGSSELRQTTNPQVRQELLDELRAATARLRAAEQTLASYPQSARVARRVDRRQRKVERLTRTLERAQRRLLQPLWTRRVTGRVLSGWLRTWLAAQRRDLGELEFLAARSTLRPQHVAGMLGVSERWLRSPAGRRELQPARRPMGDVVYERAAYTTFLGRKVAEAEAHAVGLQPARQRALTRRLAAPRLSCVAHLERDVGAARERRAQCAAVETALAAFQEASRGIGLIAHYTTTLRADERPFPVDVLITGDSLRACLEHATR